MRSNTCSTCLQLAVFVGLCCCQLPQLGRWGLVFLEGGSCCLLATGCCRTRDINRTPCQACTFMLLQRMRFDICVFFRPFCDKPVSVCCKDHALLGWVGRQPVLSCRQSRCMLLCCIINTCVDRLGSIICWLITVHVSGRSCVVLTPVALPLLRRECLLSKQCKKAHDVSVRTMLL